MTNLIDISELIKDELMLDKIEYQLKKSNGFFVRPELEGRGDAKILRFVPTSSEETAHVCKELRTT